MDVGQEAYAATGLKEQNLLAKGKRTKRQRLQISVSLISPHPNFAEPDSELFGQRNHGDVCNFSSNGGDDDEEDMANCLILLARGRPASERSSSSFRRFMAATEDQNGAGKAAACCVYECKTCSRTFPSFQALGGHRTSHKKPLIKPAMAADEKNPISESTPENEEEFKNNISNPLELRLISRSDYYNKLVNNKAHECSICGAEFMSGQALGGHMRRHRRGLGTGGGASPSASMAMEVTAEREQRPKKQRSLLSLDLDLNLPSPEDDRREQSGAIVMAAAPALVGCHY